MLTSDQCFQITYVSLGILSYFVSELIIRSEERKHPDEPKSHVCSKLLCAFAWPLFWLIIVSKISLFYVNRILRPEIEIIDNYPGVIRGIDNGIVRVSVFHSSGEAILDLNEKLFTHFKAIPGAGFSIHVERTKPGTEKIVVTPVLCQKLSDKDILKIRRCAEKIVQDDARQ